MRVEEHPPDPIERGKLGIELLAGAAYLVRTPLLAQVTRSASLAMLVLGFYESVTFAVIAALGRPPSFLGALMSVQAAGSIAGGLAVDRSPAISARLGPRHRPAGMGAGEPGLPGAQPSSRPRCDHHLRHGRPSLRRRCYHRNPALHATPAPRPSQRRNKHRDQPGANRLDRYRRLPRRHHRLPTPPRRRRSRHHHRRPTSHPPPLPSSRAPRLAQVARNTYSARLAWCLGATNTIRTRVSRVLG